MTVVVYGKRHCSLCEKTLAVLAHLQRDFGHRIDYVDITVDPVLASLYREAIPVVAIDGVEITRGRVTLPAMRSALSAAAARRQ